MEQKVCFFSAGVPIAGVIGIPDDYRQGEKRAGIVFCCGFISVKEIHIPANAEYMRRRGYVTLRFDYRYFGESGGEPRSRLIPQDQVADIQSAVTFLQHRPEVDPERIGLYGHSWGFGNVSYVAGIDDRIKCTVGIGGPADCERQFRLGTGFERFLERVKRARTEFILTGKPTYADVSKFMGRDPEMARVIEEQKQLYSTWRPEFTFESLADVMRFKPESVVHQIAPRAIMWLFSDADKLVSQFEGTSFLAKAREPKQLVILNGLTHDDMYREPGFSQVMEHTRAWFAKYLPAR